MLIIPKSEMKPNPERPAPPQRAKIEEKKIFSEGLSLKYMQDLLNAASPRPWTLTIGRLNALRADVLDANNKLVFHSHAIVGSGNEATPNWQNDLTLAINVINNLEEIIKLKLGEK